MNKQERIEYLHQCEARVRDMDRKIADLKQLVKLAEPGSFDHTRHTKRLARCLEIKENNLKSIYLTNRDLNLPTNARFKGVPTIVNEK